MKSVLNHAVTALALGAAAALVAVVAPHVTAGPLAPPAGPVASSYKTLQQIEPRSDIAAFTAGFGARHFINQPGSYYLSSNISLSAGEVAIGIFSDNVTIDLNGFSILGNGVSDDGIFCNGFSNITIRNGVISGTVKEGLDFFQANNVRIENLTVRNASNGFGIIVGESAVIRDCTVTGSGAGFITGPAASLHHCVAKSNTGPGYQLGQGSTATNCVSASNGGNGFEVGSFVSISYCTTTSNGASGIEIFQGVLSEGVRIDRCTISDNQLDGIRQLLAVDCSFTENTITRNRRTGLRIDDGNLVLRNHIANNGTTGVAEGGLLLASGSVQNVVDSNTFVANAPASLVLASGSSANSVLRNTFTAGLGISNSSSGNTVAATVAGPSNALATTNPLANITH